MVKKGIEHHLCREHGAHGIIISEMPPTSRHRFKVECAACAPLRWIGWCSEKQAEEFAQRYGYRIQWDFYLKPKIPNNRAPARLPASQAKAHEQSPKPSVVTPGPNGIHAKGQKHKVA